MLQVALSGIGVEAQPTLAERIEAIIAFFNSSVENGALEGNGQGNSARNKLKVLLSRLDHIRTLILRGNLVRACRQLTAVYKKTDGNPGPKDWVKGEAVPILADMIQELMIEMECE